MPFKTILHYFDTECSEAQPQNTIIIHKPQQKKKLSAKIDTTLEDQEFLSNFLMPKKQIAKKSPSQLEITKKEHQDDNDQQQKEKVLYVYTDGSCILNGKPNAKGAWAVFFPNGEFPNMSERYRDHPTNQRCELTAIWRALEVIKPYLLEGGRAELYTDSEYSIKCITEYCRNWSKNGWLKADKKPIENRDIIEPLYGLYNILWRNLQIKHIRAHTGNQDKHSIANDTVDQMARAAISYQ